MEAKPTLTTNLWDYIKESSQLHLIYMVGLEDQEKNESSSIYETPYRSNWLEYSLYRTVDLSKSERHCSQNTQPVQIHRVISYVWLQSAYLLDSYASSREHSSRWKRTRKILSNCCTKMVQSSSQSPWFLGDSKCEQPPGSLPFQCRGLSSGTSNSHHRLLETKDWCR